MSLTKHVFNLDTTMMVHTSGGGQERTEKEFKDLSLGAGFADYKVILVKAILEQSTPLSKWQDITNQDSEEGDVRMGIYDAMKMCKANVSTVCLGLAASMGAFLLASGSKGKRFCMPNAIVMIHQPLGTSGGKYVSSVFSLLVDFSVGQLVKDQISFNSFVNCCSISYTMFVPDNRQTQLIQQQQQRHSRYRNHIDKMTTEQRIAQREYHRLLLWIRNCTTPWRSKELFIILDFKTKTTKQGFMVRITGGIKVKADGNKSLPYVAMLAAQVVAARCKELGITTLHIKLRAIGGNNTKTLGTSAQFALHALARFGLKIGHIEDVTPIPTNGTRRKSRKSLVLTIVVVIMVVDLCLVGTFFFLCFDELCFGSLSFDHGL
ncbi:hypothetical protein IFM89_020283 [Coptis chinensis]|uniref:Endopeptidase Clp n=1 Tax=Coptis chinensis TaxID=261450 RepID=A0A835M486_9MAGN|nr:hypothetical protein IFM89_020283 [Coptis chinensis]